MEHQDCQGSDNGESDWVQEYLNAPDAVREKQQWVMQELASRPHPTLSSEEPLHAHKEDTNEPIHFSPTNNAYSPHQQSNDASFLMRPSSETLSTGVMERVNLPVAEAVPVPDSGLPADAERILRFQRLACLLAVLLLTIVGAVAITVPLVLT